MVLVIIYFLGKGLDLERMYARIFSRQIQFVLFYIKKMGVFIRSGYLNKYSNYLYLSLRNHKNCFFLSVSETVECDNCLLSGTQKPLPEDDMLFETRLSFNNTLYSLIRNCTASRSLHWLVSIQRL